MKAPASPVCPVRHPTTPSLRCWKRFGHDDQHLTVVPNVDTSVVTKPLVARWS